MASEFLARLSRPFNGERIVSSTNGLGQLEIHMKKNEVRRRGGQNGGVGEHTSAHGHTEITATYRATTCENDLKTSRKDFPQIRHKEGTTRDG